MFCLISLSSIFHLKFTRNFLLSFFTFYEEEWSRIPTTNSEWRNPIKIQWFLFFTQSRWKAFWIFLHWELKANLSFIENWELRLERRWRRRKNANLSVSIYIIIITLKEIQLLNIAELSIRKCWKRREKIRIGRTQITSSLWIPSKLNTDFHPSFWLTPTKIHLMGEKSSNSNRI